MYFSCFWSNILTKSNKQTNKILNVTNSQVSTQWWNMRWHRFKQALTTYYCSWLKTNKTITISVKSVCVRVFRGSWWRWHHPKLNSGEQIMEGGEMCQNISMIYGSTGGRTQHFFSEWADLLSLLMTFYSRPFPLLSELSRAIHNPAESYLINHCSSPSSLHYRDN